ncbi:hypothetical protein N658DRAFT_140725 [Parathielavia hyrcaniae]|uniref:Uncharacterized protein n=1 Tax=Parathielavia hyrcaniae TaxID=113614 RepID=A0AAN6PYJ9_9PEZI|nr:hypothetical protein N658DRAFT_140725 [Parathielavia hyrcaniae]
MESLVELRHASVCRIAVEARRQRQCRKDLIKATHRASISVGLNSALVSSGCCEDLSLSLWALCGVGITVPFRTKSARAMPFLISSSSVRPALAMKARWSRGLK